MNIQFRKALETDTSILLKFMKTFYAMYNYPFDSHLTESNLRQFISNSSLGKILMIEENDEIIGYMVLSFMFSFEFKGHNAFIDELYIEESYRGKRVGTKIMEFAVSEAKKLGLKAIHLEVERGNSTAMRLYRNSKFKDHNRMLMTRMIE